MSCHYNFKIFYGGYFKEDPVFHYSDGQVGYRDEVDPDYVAYFDIEEWLEPHGYVKGDSIFYLKPQSELVQDGLVLIQSDKEVMEMLACHSQVGTSNIKLYVVSASRRAVNARDSGSIGPSDADSGAIASGCAAGLSAEDVGGAINEAAEAKYVARNEAGGSAGYASPRDAGAEGESSSDEEYDPMLEDSDSFKFTDESETDDMFDEHPGMQSGNQGGIKTRLRKGNEGPSIVSEGDSSSCSDELHSPPPSDDEVPRRNRYEEFIPERDMNNPSFKVGMLFASCKVFKEALKEFSILDGREMKFVKNDKERVTATCKKECGWRIHGAKIKGEETFQVKTIQPKHSCGRSYLNRQATAKWLGSKYVENFRDDAKWKTTAFMNDVRRSYKIDISKAKAYRAKNKAIKLIQGDFVEQYAQLWSYTETLKQCNVGTYVKLGVETPRLGLHPSFQRLFINLAAQRVGFTSSCRRFIGLDGCFLKSPYGGHLLSAVGRDANDNFYPVAMAVVEAETKNSWIWFLENLITCLGTIEEYGWTFISDRQKGLVEAFRVVTPNAENRFCVRHLYANFRDMGFKGKALKDALWGAATAFTKYEFDLKMKDLKELNEAAFKYLDQIDSATWSRHAFSPRSKCDLVVNNLTESFNAYILEARDKPIVSMVEYIRTLLMSRYYKKREGINKLNQNIPPKIQGKLEKSKMEAASCKAICSGSGIYQVDFDSKSMVVNLTERTCGCRKWDLSGIPCTHAVAAIDEDLRQPEEYVFELYTKPYYLQSYQPLIYPVPSKEQWVHTDYPPLLPPKPRKAPGRPKKARRRGIDEPKKGSGIRLRSDSLRCSNCMKFGYNMRTCSEPLNPNRKVHKRKRNDSVAKDTSEADIGPRFVQNSQGIGVSYEDIQTVTRRSSRLKEKFMQSTQIHEEAPSQGSASVNVSMEGSVPSQVLTSTAIEEHFSIAPRMKFVDKQTTMGAAGQPSGVTKKGTKLKKVAHKRLKTQAVPTQSSMIKKPVETTRWMPDNTSQIRIMTPLNPVIHETQGSVSSNAQDPTLRRNEDPITENRRSTRQAAEVQKARWRL